MIELRITGLGAVSPAGWDVGSLRAALRRGEALPVAALERPGGTGPLRVRRVPVPQVRPSFLGHARLRRTSPITHYAVAAALGALGMPPGTMPTPVEGADRLGLVFCTMTGSVLYSRRFFEGALENPATASPLLFPETVFNAPASHLAALLGLSGRVQTEVGDATCFPGGLRTAALWLEAGWVDRCLLVAAEELDWLPAAGLALHDRRTVAAEGAGALLLERDADGSAPALAWLDGWLDQGGGFPPDVVGCDGGYLVDDLGDGGRLNRRRAAANTGWCGSRCSPKWVLGEAWAAGAAWQCVEAIAALAEGGQERARVAVLGTEGWPFEVFFRRREGRV